MKIVERSFIDESEAAREHSVVLRRETRDHIGAERDIGAQRPGPPASSECLSARMAALHALQDHVVAGLNREMEMRHQPFLLSD
jgi:hypothetical protein